MTPAKVKNSSLWNISQKKKKPTLVGSIEQIN